MTQIDQPPKGGFHDAFQFGRQIRLTMGRLREIFSNKDFKVEEFAELEGSTLRSAFERYFRVRPGLFSQFKLVLFIWPRQKQLTQWQLALQKVTGKQIRQPAKKNFHFVLICDFFAQFLNDYFLKEGYEQCSLYFLQVFGGIPWASLHWLSYFHIHFISEKDVGRDMEFWKEFINDQHKDSLTDLLEYDGTFIEVTEKRIDENDQFAERSYPKADPEEIYQYCQATIRKAKQ
jgi:hypothetical protein